MYDFRCATRTTAPLRAYAQRAVSADGQRECVAPTGANRRWGGGESTRTTAPLRAHAQRAVSADGQRECVAPTGANRRWGGGESIFDVRLGEFAHVARGELSQ